MKSRKDNDAHKPFIVGLTGGIGSGKSVVAKCFAQYGVAIVDTDALAHQLTTAGGAAMPAIVDAFGPDVLNVSGDLNRATMREIIFKDAACKKKLESILHPLIHTQAEQACADAVDAPYVMLEIPLLVESVNVYALKRILVVDCPEELQITRAMQRSALSADAVRAIMATQATRAERLAIADDIIYNTQDIAALDAQVKKLHAVYWQMASAIRATNHVAHIK